MRRSVLLVLGWIGATAMATLVAWQGVGIVRREVTASRPPVLSAADVQAELEQTPAPTPTPTPPAATPETTTTTTSPSTPPPTTTTTGPPVTSETRNYNVVGGSAAVRFEDGTVTLVWATPNAGFEADVEQSSPAQLRVRFRSDGHESRIEARWEGGPVDEVEERESSGGGPD